ncbi:MAG: autotransporter outer membrane beta-barrel domain-containing protein [Hasllibacter sp.]
MGRNTRSGDAGEGENTALTVSDDQSGGTVNAMDGGDVTVADGGSVGGTSAMSGGSVTVQSGGSAGVNASSGQGGSLTFESGSTAMVEGQATAADQNQTIAGADFQDGTRVMVSNSAVLSGTAAGDTVTLGLAADAFERFGGSDNARSVGAAIDAAIAGGDPDATGLILGDAESLAAAVADAGGEDRAQVAALGVGAAFAFSDLLAARGAIPLDAGTVGTVGTAGMRMAGPTSLAGRQVWSTVYGGRLDVDGGVGTAFEGSYGGVAVGIEQDFAFGTAGVAVGASRGDVSGSGEFDAVSLGVYADRVSGPLRLAGSLAYTRFDLELDGADAGDGEVLIGRIEAAYDIDGAYGGARMLAPYAALSYAVGEVDGGATTAGALRDGEIEQGVATVGVRAARAFDAGGTPARAYADLRYERVFGDEGVIFAGDAFGGTIATIGATGEDDRIALGLGAEFDVAPGAAVSLSYDGTFGGGRDDRLGVSYTMRF